MYIFLNWSLKPLNILTLPYIFKTVLLSRPTSAAFLPHLYLDKIAACSQTTFSNAFSWMKSFVFWFEFLWTWLLCVQLILSQHWFCKWLGVEQATSHCLNQCWSRLLMQICVTRPQCVNTIFMHLHHLMRLAVIIIKCQRLTLIYVVLRAWVILVTCTGEALTTVTAVTVSELRR